MSSFGPEIKFSSRLRSPHRVTRNSIQNHLKIVVTGGAGQIAYSLLPLLCKGEIFGPSTFFTLHLLDIPPAMKALEGVRMELEDACYTLVKDVICTSNLEVAFFDVDYAIILGGFPRRAGMDRKDLIEKNVSIMNEQGRALDQYAKKTCKILVTSNPANTNCLTLMKYAPSIPSKNFSCLTRLDQDRFKGMLLSKLNKMPVELLKSLLGEADQTFAATNEVNAVSSSMISSIKLSDEDKNKNDFSIANRESFAEENQLIKQCIVWGNHSNTQYPWTGLMEINGKAVANLIHEKQSNNTSPQPRLSYLKGDKSQLGWLKFDNLSEACKNCFELEDIVARVKTRGAAVLEARKLSSALSAANSIKNHLIDWHFGTTKDKYISMGVLSTGNPYGIPDDLIYSFPVSVDFKTGVWQFAPVQEISLNESDRQCLINSSTELEEEKAIITNLPFTRNPVYPLESTKSKHDQVGHIEVSRL